MQSPAITGTIRAPTEFGNAFINKVTHPPTTLLNNYRGVPDTSSPTVVVMELKGETNFLPLFTYPVNDTTVATIGTPTIVFLQTSGALISNYYFLLDNGGWVQPHNQSATVGVQPAITQPQGVQGQNRFAGYNFSNFVNDVESFRTTYKSTTYYLNATDFSNQGTVTSAKFKPSIISETDTSFFKRAGLQERTALINVLPPKIQKHMKTLVNLTGYDDLSSGPTAAYSFQFWNHAAPGATGASISGSTDIFRSFSPSLPKNAGEVLAMSPKAATRPAKEGAFVVQQKIADVYDWCDVFSAQDQVTENPAGLTLSYMRFIDTATGAVTFTRLYNNASGALNENTAETPWNNLDWSITMFEGLTVSTGAAPSELAGIPYITTKSFIGLEFQPQAGGSIMPFATTLPMPDEDAIRIAAGIFHARPDSLPASANDFGAIASVIGKYLPTAIEWIGDLFGSKSKRAAATEKINSPKKVANIASEVVGSYDRAVRRSNPSAGLTRQIAQLTQQVRQMSAGGTTLPSYISNPNAVASQMAPRARQPPRRPRAPAIPVATALPQQPPRRNRRIPAIRQDILRYQQARNRQRNVLPAL